MSHPRHRRETLWDRAGLPRLLISLAVVALLGLGATHLFSEAAVSRERANLVSLSRTAVTAIDPADLAALSGSEADLRHPAYQELKQVLLRIREANPDIRFVYLLAAREPGDEKLYFVADSEPASSEDYSAPGDVYEETTAAELEGYRAGRSFAEGPQRDSWGEWVSAMTPVIDPATGAVRGLLGLDVSTRLFDQRVREAATLPIALALFLSALVMAHWLFVRRAKRHEAELVQEREISRVVLADLPVGVIVARYPGGEVVLQNPQAWSLAEGEGAEARASDFRFVTATGTPYPAEDVPLAMTLATGAKAAKDDLFIARPGGNFRLRAESVPVRGADGAVRFAVMVLEPHP